MGDISDFDSVFSFLLFDYFLTMEKIKVGRKRLKKISAFLMNFADALMVSGTQTSRIVRNVKRLSENFDCRVDLIMLPKTIIMTLKAESGISITTVRKISPENPDFTKLSELRILSWEALSNNYSLEKCESEFDDILKGQKPHWFKIAPIVAIGNAAFCQLFGGFWSLPLVFTGTLVGFAIRRKLMEKGLGAIPSFACAAFVSAFIAGIGAIVFDFKTDIAISTSVLWLVPGVPLLNAVIDIFDGHILAGFSRLVKALELIFAVSFGLLAAILILGHSII